MKICILSLLLLIHNSVSFLPRPSSFAAYSKSQLEAHEDEKKKIVVIGNGMVGQRFMENILSYDKEEKTQLYTFSEEPRAAYNRVRLTSYFETLNPNDLSMTEEFSQDG